MKQTKEPIYIAIHTDGGGDFWCLSSDKIKEQPPSKEQLEGEWYFNSANLQFVRLWLNYHLLYGMQPTYEEVNAIAKDEEVVNKILEMCKDEVENE